jgi:hypothetical protein
MQNYRNIKVPVKTWATHVANTQYFRIGYESYLKGKDFDYNIFNTADEFSYARGRAFAIWCMQQKKPRAQWRKGKAAKTLVERVCEAVYAKIFI